MIIGVGIGPGDMNYLTQRGAALIRDAEWIVGFRTVNEFARPLASPAAEFVHLTYKNQVEELERAASAHHEGKNVVVLFMGDPHFSGFQMIERVEKACGHRVEVIPGISAAQILASKAKVCFDETTFVTFHRRGDLEPFKRHLVHVLRDDRNAIVIPHTWDLMPSAVCRYLLEQGISGEHPVEVWENLTGMEATWSGTLAACTQEFSDMSIMLIRALQPMPSQV
jgi:precorrin-6y C5,15-methyltransferase (decarboxylating) CbiE subunit